MRKVTKINATKHTSRKTKTAAYCRVSTDRNEQLQSLETQKSHYEAFIKANSDWEYAGLYHDEGLSGTRLDNRDGLQRLLRDCEQRKVDFIITKSISRFARSTTGILETVRKLSDLGIFILFEKEGIHTGAMEGELLLAVLSGLAESESVSLSENAKWSVKSRMQKGTFKHSFAPYGFDLCDGDLIPNAEQAKVVRRIFAAFISGMGCTAIADMLEKEEVPSKRGGNWTNRTICRMLSNERMVGDALLGKTFSDHFKRYVNRGEEEQIYIRDHHEAIISREDFEKVQEILVQRRKSKNITKNSQKYSQRYAFSGKIICGSCGQKLKRFARKGRTMDLIDWKCETKSKHGMKTCAMPDVPNEAVQATFVTMMQQLYINRETLLTPHIQSLNGQDGNQQDQRLQEFQTQLQANAERAQNLVGFMSKGFLTPALFTEQMNELEAEAVTLKKEIAALTIHQDSTPLSEAEGLYTFLVKNGTDLETFSDDIFTAFVENVTAISRDEVAFNLKCGLSINQKFKREKRKAPEGSGK